MKWSIIEPFCFIFIALLAGKITGNTETNGSGGGTIIDNDKFDRLLEKFQAIDKEQDRIDVSLNFIMLINYYNCAIYNFLLHRLI